MLPLLLQASVSSAPLFAAHLFACRYTGFFYEGTLAGPQQRPWFLSFTFAVACCVIVSGCLAERTRLLVYPLYTVLIAALVHPLIVHWVWVDSSWLNTLSSCRALDFAGGLAVHALGERCCCLAPQAGRRLRSGCGALLAAPDALPSMIVSRAACVLSKQRRS